MKPLFALLRASLTGFWRDRAALIWTFLFPIALLGLFAVLFAGSSGAPNFHVGWVDQAESAEARQARATLEGAGVFAISDADESTALADMKAGRTKAILIAPPGYGAQPAVQLTLRIDPSDRTTSGTIVALAERALGGDGAARASLAVVPIQDQVQSAASYFLPTILAMALMQLGVYSAVTLVQQRERQVLKRFATAPIARWSIVGSFVGSRLVVAVIQAVLMLAAGRFVAGAALPSNLLLLALLVLLIAATFIAMGFAIAGLARSEEAATQITGLVSLPLMFLSGLFVPLEQLPDIVRPVAQLSPLTYAADALRQVMVQGTPMVPLGIGALVLGAWLIGSLAAATRLFRWQ